MPWVLCRARPSANDQILYLSDADDNVSYIWVVLYLYWENEISIVFWISIVLAWQNERVLKRLFHVRLY